MIWENPLFRRRTVRFRPITVVGVVSTCAIVLAVITRWMISPPVHTPSQAEMKAIQAALVQHSTRNSQIPHTDRVIKAIKLEGTGWIVQITDRYNTEPGGLRVINTYHVGSNSSCQWLSVDESGSY